MRKHVKGLRRLQILGEICDQKDKSEKQNTKKRTFGKAERIMQKKLKNNRPCKCKTSQLSSQINFIIMLEKDIRAGCCPSKPQIPSCP